MEKNNVPDEVVEQQIEMLQQKKEQRLYEIAQELALHHYMQDFEDLQAPTQNILLMRAEHILKNREDD